VVLSLVDLLLLVPFEDEFCVFWVSGEGSGAEGAEEVLGVDVEVVLALVLGVVGAPVPIHLHLPLRTVRADHQRLELMFLHVEDGVFVLEELFMEVVVVAVVVVVEVFEVVVEVGEAEGAFRD